MRWLGWVRLRHAIGLALVLFVMLGAGRAVWTNNDSDGDSVSDCRERAGLQVADSSAIWETDPNEADSDGDGITDSEEVGRRLSESNVAATRPSLVVHKSGPLLRPVRPCPHRHGR